MPAYTKPTYLMGNEIALYKLEGAVKGNWYCRFSDPTGKKVYVRKSTKTTEFSLASKRAIDLYNEINAKVRLGAEVTETSWNFVFQKFIDELVGRRKKLAMDYNKRFWKPYFSDSSRFKEIYYLNDEDLKGYWSWRIQFWKNNAKLDENGKLVDPRSAARKEFKTSPTTLKMEANILKFFIKKAFHKNLIGQMPQVLWTKMWNAHPLVTSIPVKKRRGRFDDESIEIVRKWWRRTRRILNETAEKPYSVLEHNSDWQKSKDERVVWNHPCNRYSRALLWITTIVIANTGIRPVEIVQLKWRDINPVWKDEDGTEYTIINITDEVSKVGKQRDVIARDYRETYDRLMEFKREWIRYFGREPKDDEIIFANANHKDVVVPWQPQQAVRRWLISLKTKSGESVYLSKYGDVEIPRTLYSFRALFITERLKNGMDAYTCARATGTSIEMIQKYYDYNKNIQFRNDITRHYKHFEFAGDESHK